MECEEFVLPDWSPPDDGWHVPGDDDDDEMSRQERHDDDSSRLLLLNHTRLLHGFWGELKLKDFHTKLPDGLWSARGRDRQGGQHWRLLLGQECRPRQRAQQVCNLKASIV